MKYTINAEHYFTHGSHHFCLSLCQPLLIQPGLAGHGQPWVGSAAEHNEGGRTFENICNSPWYTNPVTLVKLLKGFFQLNIRIVMVSINHTVNFMQVFILEGNSTKLFFPALFLTSLSAILDRTLAAYILLLWSGCSAWMWRLGLSSQTGRK